MEYKWDDYEMRIGNRRFNRMKEGMQKRPATISQN